MRTDVEPLAADIAARHAWTRLVTKLLDMARRRLTSADTFAVSAS
ncbi:MAG: hypothetical protein AAGE94_24080 [Acidobacteriota bacterium]